MTTLLLNHKIGKFFAPSISFSWLGIASLESLYRRDANPTSDSKIWRDIGLRLRSLWRCAFTFVRCNQIFTRQWNGK